MYGNVWLCVCMAMHALLCMHGYIYMAECMYGYVGLGEYRVGSHQMASEGI